MAMREVGSCWRAGSSRLSRMQCHRTPQCLRSASTAAAAADLQDLDAASSFDTQATDEAAIKAFDPVAPSRTRTEQLPRSRYQYRPPRYYRGPLHPHQPPRPSDPASREFVPGPFSLTRFEQTYESTIAPDLMTLSYQHFPPGYEPPKKGPRLRPWEGDSPYFKNRPLRGPRGGDNLRLLRHPITFRNIPKIERVTVHSMVKKAVESSQFLHIAGMVLQAITGVTAEAHPAKHNVQNWGLRQGKYVSVTADLRGEQMYHFLGTTIDVVLPRIRDWKGIKTSSGDRSGNISFGLPAESMSLFPAIEVNYDMYPPKAIPGCHVTLHTTARTDKDARLLVTALGIPFDGNIVD